MRLPPGRFRDPEVFMGGTLTAWLLVSIVFSAGPGIHRLLAVRPGESPGQDRESGGRLSRFEFEETHMASPFHLVLYSMDEATARRASRAAFDRIAALNAVLSDYDAGERAFEAVASGRRAAGSGQRRPVRRARAIPADVRAIGRGVRRHDRPGGPALAASTPRPESCRTRRGSPRRGNWSAPTRWCSTPRPGPSGCSSRE